MRNALPKLLQLGCLHTGLFEYNKLVCVARGTLPKEAYLPEQYILQLPRGSIVVPFWDIPYRILYMNPKKELLWSLVVASWINHRLCGRDFLALMACLSYCLSGFGDRRRHNVVFVQVFI